VREARQSQKQKWTVGGTSSPGKGNSMHIGCKKGRSERRLLWLDCRGWERVHGEKRLVRMIRPLLLMRKSFVFLSKKGSH
jgi:hypothetical protein